MNYLNPCAMRKQTTRGLTVSGIGKVVIYLGLLLPAALFYGCSGEDNGPPDPHPNTVTLNSSGIMPSSGVLIAQYDDSPDGYDLSKAVDNNTSTKFITNHGNFNLMWSGNTSVAVNYYSLTSADDSPGKDPKAWSLYGSSDNAAWVLLDSRSEQAFSGRKEKREYEFTNQTAYKYLKLSIEGNNGGSSTQIAELSIKWIPTGIEDLMTYASGRTHSTFTPMGNHYAGRHITGDDDRTWLNTASNEPALPAANTYMHWAEFDVDLYPFGDPSPADVNQHGIGDCSALAVFASLAYIYPDFVKNLIRDNGDKTYTVSMFDPQGEPVRVTVTSRFLASDDGKIQATTGKNDAATWSTVLEKAIMKWNAIYRVNPDINGIGSEHVAPLFTRNGDSFAFSPGLLSNEQLARIVKVCLKEGKIVVGGFNPGGLYAGSYQTVSAHAYTLTHSVSSTALFAMRNPWGCSPTGNGYSDGKEDGILNIPNNSIVPPTIDLRIMSPGIAGAAGVTDPYSPPSFAVGAGNRISEQLLRSGM